VVWKIVGALVIDHAWFQNARTPIIQNARTPIIYDKWPGDPPFQTEEEGISDGDGKMVDVLAFMATVKWWMSWLFGGINPRNPGFPRDPQVY